MLVHEEEGKGPHRWLREFKRTPHAGGGGTLPNSDFLAENVCLWAISSTGHITTFNLPFPALRLALLVASTSSPPPPAFTQGKGR